MTLSLDDQANVALAVLFPVASFVIASRTWIKIRKLGTFGWDDATIILAWISFTVFALALYLESRVPEELSRPEGTPANFDNIRRTIILTTVSGVFYPITSLLLKASIGLFYIRIILSSRVRAIVWTIIIVSTINCIYQVFFIIFLCGNPVHYLDNAFAGSCLDTDVIAASFYEQAVVNSLADFAFVILPIHILRNSMQSRQAKGAIAAILLLGTSGSIFSVVRIPFIGNVRHSNSTDALEAVDLWSSLELGTGIIAACLPVFGSTYTNAVTKLKSIFGRHKVVWREPNGKWVTVRMLSRHRQELTVETVFPKGSIETV